MKMMLLLGNQHQTASLAFDLITLVLNFHLVMELGIHQPPNVALTKTMLLLENQHQTASLVFDLMSLELRNYTYTSTLWHY